MHLALVNLVANIDIDMANVAGDFGVNIDHLVRLKLARQVQLAHNRASRDGAQPSLSASLLRSHRRPLAPEWHPANGRTDASMIKNGKVKQDNFRMWDYTFS